MATELIQRNYVAGHRKPRWVREEGINRLGLSTFLEHSKVTLFTLFSAGYPRNARVHKRMTIPGFKRSKKFSPKQVERVAGV